MAVRLPGVVRQFQAAQEARRAFPAGPLVEGFVFAVPDAGDGVAEVSEAVVSSSPKPCTGMRKQGGNKVCSKNLLAVSRRAVARNSH